MSDTTQIPDTAASPELTGLVLVKTDQPVSMWSLFAAFGSASILNAASAVAAVWKPINLPAFAAVFGAGVYVQPMIKPHLDLAAAKPVVPVVVAVSPMASDLADLKAQLVELRALLPKTALAAAKTK